MEDRDVLPLVERMDGLVRRVSCDFHRSLCPLVDWTNRLVGIKGARGAGKTTLMRQHVKETFGGVTESALYVSMDDLWFSTHPFMDLVDWHHRQGGTHLFIDEIHYLKPWQQCLKNVYDFYPDMRVGYTGSSMLQIGMLWFKICRLSCVVFAACLTLTAHARDFDVRDYGAKGDGVTKDTAAIQAAIDACASKGGGRVVLDGGRFLSGTITLKSGVDLHLEATATLLGSRDCADYPERTGLRHVVSANLPRERNACFIWAEEAHDIAISGRGKIDCQGDAFVRKAQAGDGAWAPFVRIPGLPTPPRVVFFAGCCDVRLTDITMVNQPAGWSYWLTDCDRVWCDRLRIDADLRFPNNDGIHVNCSRDVFISNCFISTCDDAIVVRANSRALKECRPCERVHVMNCSLRSACACIRIGYLNDGVIRDCVFSNLTMNRSGRGIRMELPPFKAKPDRGCEATLIENLSFSNIEMRDVRKPVHFVIAETPETLCDAVRDIHFSNVRATGGGRLVFRGRSTNPIERLTFLGCVFKTQEEHEMVHCTGFVGI